MFHEPAEPDATGGAITFTSAPLASDHVLRGHAEAHLRATLSASDANFYVELVDVDMMGKETLVNDGFLKASHLQSDVTPTPVMSGAPIDYVVPIRAADYRFVVGHKVKLRISGAKSSRLTPVMQPVDIVVQAGAASTLHLSPSW
jgi:predicted acyl esterase